VLLETPWIPRKTSTSRTGPYPLAKVYKNGAVKVQKVTVSERMNIRQIFWFQETSGWVLPLSITTTSLQDELCEA
jgi:hypothetical protein